jgi:hypothetical protein
MVENKMSPRKKERKKKKGTVLKFSAKKIDLIPFKESSEIPQKSSYANVFDIVFDDKRAIIVDELKDLEVQRD